MTQRDRILRALELAGPKGVRSDAFIKDFMPRAAARVQELKDEGYDITSEREGKFCRWTLNVGSSTEGRDQAEPGGTYQPVDATSGVASGVEALVPSSSPQSPGESTTGSARSSMYETWVED